MQKNQSARLQMKTDVNVAKIKTTCLVIWTSPKYVPSSGYALASPIIAKLVKLGGPTAMNIAGLEQGLGSPN